MENLSKYSSTELLKMINETNISHEQLKQEIINHSFEIDKLDREINDKMTKLEELEKKYIELIEEINNRNNVV